MCIFCNSNKDVQKMRLWYWTNRHRFMFKRSSPQVIIFPKVMEELKREYHNKVISIVKEKLYRTKNEPELINNIFQYYNFN